MSSYDSLSHAKLSIMYHIILSTRYKRRCLLGLEKAVICSIKNSLSGYRVDVLDATVDNGNHLHLVLKVRNPRVSVGDIVSRIKQQSTYDLWRDYHNILTRFYYGGEHKLWSAGYFCASVGHDDVHVKSYVKRQSV